MITISGILVDSFFLPDLGVHEDADDNGRISNGYFVESYPRWVLTENQD